MSAASTPGRKGARIVFVSAVVAVLSAALAGSATPAAAAPSKFVYEQCDSQVPGVRSPNYKVFGDTQWSLLPGENCAEPNGRFGLSYAGESPPITVWMVVSVPETPGGFVESETITGDAENLGPGNNNTFVFQSGWPTNNGSTQARTFYLRGERDPRANSGDFTINMNCATGNCYYGAASQVMARDIAAVEVDPAPPTVIGPSGSLLTPGIVRGHQELVAEAKDEGGGLSKLELLVNGISAAPPVAGACALGQANNLSYRGIVALSPSPCPPVLKSAWALNTGSPPFQNGANSVQVCASDFSTIGEANRSCSQPQTVTVDNSCSDSAVGGGEQLSAEFAHSHAEEVSVPYNAPAKVVGALTSSTGNPISGATVCVQMETQGSPRGLVPVGTATTDANGHFDYSVTGGPNRKVLIGYRHDTFELARTISYRSHVKPTIELSAGKVRTGGEILIQGKLPGGHRAAHRVVVLQAAGLHSSTWYPFEETTTGPKGRYHAEYTFDETSRTTTYRIRASVPLQGEYLYDGGHSRPALLEVRAGTRRHRHR